MQKERDLHKMATTEIPASGKEKGRWHVRCGVKPGTDWKMACKYFRALDVTSFLKIS